MTFHRKKVTCPQKMPRRKQDCPKKMNIEDAVDEKTYLSDREEAAAARCSVAVSELSRPRTPESSELKSQRSFESSETDRSTAACESPDGRAPHDAKGSPPLPPAVRSGNSAASPASEMQSTPPVSPAASDGTIPLDFSVRKNRLVKSEAASSSSPLAAALPVADLTDGGGSGGGCGDDPLDLSVPKKRRCGGVSPFAPSLVCDNKMPVTDSRTASFPSSWGSLVANFAAASAADLAALNNPFLLTPPAAVTSSFVDYPKVPTPSESSKALERMQELSRMSGGGCDGSVFRSAFSSPLNSWQNHWLSKGLHEQNTRDILKCVWCKQSFTSLANLTVHMKEAKHCNILSAAAAAAAAAVPPQHATTGKPAALKTPPDSMSLLKDNMPLPRKLVRGQDVWLGKGVEQTKQILKCMWCGQSFTSLADMTTHMQQTQHYTNIISQEQIISWKSPEDKRNNQSHVNAVLTCKVCDKAFSSLKELSSHMVKNSHYKEHIMKSISENNSRRKPSKEKRKPKSLPVRKLLEMERAQNEFRNGDVQRSYDGSGKIRCEKCGDRIDFHVFVDHIRRCVGKRVPVVAAATDPATPAADLLSSRKAKECCPAAAVAAAAAAAAADLSKAEDSGSGGETAAAVDEPLRPELADSSTSSVLNAIEQLIEKSFDVSGKARSGGRGPIGSSILQRLGIDESVDYSKPLADSHGAVGAPFYDSVGPSPFSSSYRHRSASESSGSSDLSCRKVPQQQQRGAAWRRTLHAPASETPLSSHPASSSSPVSPKLVISELESADDDAEEEDSQPASEDKKQHPPHISRSARTEYHLAPRCSSREEAEACDSAGSASSPAPLPRRDAPSFGGDPVESQQQAIVAKATSGGPPPLPMELSSSPSSEAQATTSMLPRLVYSSPCNCSRAGSSSPAVTAAADTSPSSGKAVPSSSSSSSSSGPRFHPLAALQKLCEKTDGHISSRPGATTGGTARGVSPVSGGCPGVAPSVPGSILAFSWACNDAVVNDSIMKCAFCDTPFISKGAYRHHLSKIHFVKDTHPPDAAGTAPPVPSSSSSSSSSCSSANGTATSSHHKACKSPTEASEEESPHSKFLKYTELAKQLSSKYI